MDNTLAYNKPWILQRADPYVYRHTDGSYYFTASVPEYDKIVLRRSDTLAGIKDAKELGKHFDTAIKSMSIIEMMISGEEDD